MESYYYGAELCIKTILENGGIRNKVFKIHQKNTLNSLKSDDFKDLLNNYLVNIFFGNFFFFSIFFILLICF
jgi:hypothetical protein